MFKIGDIVITNMTADQSNRWVGKIVEIRTLIDYVNIYVNAAASAKALRPQYQAHELTAYLVEKTEHSMSRFHSPLGTKDVFLDEDLKLYQVHKDNDKDNDKVIIDQLLNALELAAERIEELEHFSKMSSGATLSTICEAIKTAKEISR